MTASARGLFRTTGKASKPVPDPASILRFKAKLERVENGCLLWTGCVGSDGYGHFRFGDSIIAAHRFALAAHCGEWPTGHVLHSCDNPLCCEPSHLSEGDHRRNMRECAMRERNRTCRPGNGRRKLSDAKIVEIRARFASGHTNKSDLARQFSVTPTRIRQVLNG